MSQIADYIENSGSCRCLSHFISTSEWKHENVMEITRSAAIDMLGPGGSIIFDETGQQKYGPDSVGVSIQYLGVIGDTCAAQVGVFASYCVNNVSALIDYRLFLPESWINNHKNDEEFGVPVEKLEHKTKPVLALEMLDQFKSEEIPFSYVQADALYGGDSHFITGLYQREVAFVCDIPCSTHVYITKPELVLPERQGNRGRQPTILKVLNTTPVEVSWLADIQKNWDSVDVRFTNRGIKTVECAEATVWRRQEGMPVDTPIRVLMIRDPDEDKIRFAFTNIFGEDLHDLVRKQANRYWIERNFEDAKGLCDMDSFRGRSWLSWHHHIALAATAHLFLLSVWKYFSKKGKFLSLDQIVKVIRFNNPLRQLSAEELAESINKVNTLRAKMWLGNMKKCLEKRWNNAANWMTQLLDIRTGLTS